MRIQVAFIHFFLLLISRAFLEAAFCCCRWDTHTHDCVWMHEKSIVQMLLCFAFPLKGRFSSCVVVCLSGQSEFVRSGNIRFDGLTNRGALRREIMFDWLVRIQKPNHSSHALFFLLSDCFLFLKGGVCFHHIPVVVLTNLHTAKNILLCPPSKQSSYLVEFLR